MAKAEATQATRRPATDLELEAMVPDESRAVTQAELDEMRSRTLDETLDKIQANRIAEFKAAVAAPATDETPETHETVAPVAKKLPVEIVKSTNQIGLRFAHKPRPVVKEAIKALGFHWTETLFWTMSVNGNKAEILTAVKAILA